MKRQKKIRRVLNFGVIINYSPTRTKFSEYWLIVI